MLACRVGWVAARALGRGARHEKPHSPSIAVVLFKSGDRGLRSVVAVHRFPAVPRTVLSAPGTLLSVPSTFGARAFDFARHCAVDALASAFGCRKFCSLHGATRLGKLASDVGSTALRLGSLGGCAECGVVCKC